MNKYFKQLITNPLFSGSAIMIFGSNGVSFVNYLYHMIMGRMLGPSGYGELASLISLIGLLGVIPGSINLVIIKYVSSAKKQKELNILINWLKKKIFIFFLIFSGFLLITSPLISKFLNIQLSYIVLISISFLIFLQAGLNRAIMQGLLKFKEMMMSILAENSSKLIMSILLVYFGFGVGGVMFSLVLSALLGWYITQKYLKYRQTKVLTLPTSQIKSMLFFTIPVTIQSIATTSLYSSDVILVRHFFSSHEAGLYAALSTLGKIIFFAAGPISTVMFPLVAQRKSRGQDYKQLFVYSLLTTTIFAVSILILYFLVPKLAITMLYGPDYLEAAGLLVWFGVFMTLFTLSSLVINYGLSLGKNRIVVLPLIFAIIQIVLIIFFHKTLFEVIIISTIVTALLLLSLLIYSSFREGFTNGKRNSNRRKIDFYNSSGI